MATKLSGGDGLRLAVVLMLLPVLSGDGGGVAEEDRVHHVVGGDRGWDVASGVAEWSVDKVFRVGDNLWFTYSAAQESIAELRSREEFESCDVSNPIKMYTDGLDKVTLVGEGTRYFISSKTESCKNGLKLHVDVLPQANRGEQATAAASVKNANVHVLAVAPTVSSSVHFGVNFQIWIALPQFWVMGFLRA